MCRLICQKPAHFLSAQMAWVSTFFQMFIVLGMYNFAPKVKRGKCKVLKKRQRHALNDTRSKMHFKCHPYKMRQMPRKNGNALKVIPR